MPTPGVVREFIGMSSPTARRAGAGGNPCQGLYHRGVGRKPKVAMIATHYQIDFSEHYLADYSPPAASDSSAGIPGSAGSKAISCSTTRWSTSAWGEWLREFSAWKHIVLLGNSGGGSLMAAYQSQAVDPNVTPLDGMRPAAGLGDLPTADGYVASAAHPGGPKS